MRSRNNTMAGRYGGVLALSFALGASVSGCGIAEMGTDEASNFEGSSPSQTQSASALEALHAAIDEGKIPKSGAVDAASFFADHQVSLPPPNCSQDLCVHASFATHPTLYSQAPSAMLLVGVNSSRDPATLRRPPMHVALVLDLSEAMGGAGRRQLQSALLELLKDLRPEDRVTLIAAAESATVAAQAKSPSDKALTKAIDALSAAGDLDFYAALERAYNILGVNARKGETQRVLAILAQSPNGNSGSDERLEKMIAQAQKRSEQHLSILALGTRVDIGEARRWTALGRGDFYFVQSPYRLPELMRDAKSLLPIPFAREIHIDVDLKAPFRLRRVYGASTRVSRDGEFRVTLPLYHLRSNSETSASRDRVFVIEVEPTAPSDDPLVAELELHYRPADQKLLPKQSIQAVIPVADIPKKGYFEEQSTRRAFGLVQIIANYERALKLWGQGKESSAHALLSHLETNLQAWLKEKPDAQLEKELRHLQRLRELIADKLGSKAKKKGSDTPKAVLPADPVAYPEGESSPEDERSRR